MTWKKHGMVGVPHHMRDEPDVIPGMYLGLWDGRKLSKERGFGVSQIAGPLFGPLAFCHVEAAINIRFGFRDDGDVLLYPADVMEKADLGGHYWFVLKNDAENGTGDYEFIWDGHAYMAYSVIHIGENGKEVT